MADTPVSTRKRNLSATPPNTNESSKGDSSTSKDIVTSPKITQDIKKRVIEVQDDVVKSVPDAAGSDPVRSADPVNSGNMAAVNNNIVEPATKRTVPSNPVKPLDLKSLSLNANKKVETLPDLGQRITHSAVRRGRPRRSRALSVDPPIEEMDTDSSMMQMLHAIKTNMSTSQINQARFENNMISSLDSKLGEFKSLLDSNVSKLQSDVDKHDLLIEKIQQKCDSLDVKTLDYDVKVDELEDEIGACRRQYEEAIGSVNEHVSTIETSLAKDIEHIRTSAESKFNEHQEQQRGLENRIQDMTTHMDTENQRLSNELEDLKSRFSNLQTLVEESDIGTDEASGAGSQRRCEKCSNCSGDRSSASSVFSDQNVIPNPISTNRLNSYRSLIINGVIESRNENLAALCLKFVREMDIDIQPEDIEVAYRLGTDPSKYRPRPVKLVLKNEILRDQIYHFKLRLRNTRFFKTIQISLDQQKELRVKMGILKWAATNARAQGYILYSSDCRVKIDGVEYDIAHVDEIPEIFLGTEGATNQTVPPPPPPFNVRRLSMYDRARKKSERAIELSTGLQKTDWCLLFFSAGCFLSNFYRCQISFQGYKFKSLEQGYQALMAKTCQNPLIFHEIMETDSPSDAKAKTKGLIKTEEWDRIKLDIMRDLLFCKFKQNRNLYFKLLNTRPHALYECTLDNYWGTGCRLLSVMSVEGDWGGSNHLGILLMHVRDVLVSEI